MPLTQVTPSSLVTPFYFTGDFFAPNLVTTGQTGLFYPMSNPSGFSTGSSVDTSSLVKYTDLPVYQTGNQTISGVKAFVSRMTVNGTGVMLSGEAAAGAGLTQPQVLARTLGA